MQSSEVVEAIATSASTGNSEMIPGRNKQSEMTSADELVGPRTI
jgi:hypothetical protein